MRRGAVAFVGFGITDAPLKTLHWYLTRQVMATLTVAVAVFSFVLLLGNVLKEILTLLVSGQASLATIGYVVLLLIPYTLVFALPMGLLTTTLLVFGRLSADHELTAIRASGVSLLSLVSPILILGTAWCVVSAVINFEFAPRCRHEYRSILREVGLKRFGAFVQEKTFIRDFPGHIVYIGKLDKTGTNMQDVMIYELGADGELESYVRAAEGQLVLDPAQSELRVRLMDSWRVSMRGGWRDPHYASEVEMPPIQVGDDRRRKPALVEMTLGELFGELRDLEQRLAAPVPGRRADTEEISMAMTVLRRQGYDVALPIKVQIHRQISFSFACLGFTLIGIPLGVRTHRRETTFGVAVALMLVLVYYSFFIVSQVLESKPQFNPQYIVWLPNILFEAVGGVLLWRANRSA